MAVKSLAKQAHVIGTKCRMKSRLCLVWHQADEEHASVITSDNIRLRRLHTAALRLITYQASFVQPGDGSVSFPIVKPKQRDRPFVSFIMSAHSAENQHVVLHKISPQDCMASPAGCMESARSAVWHQADKIIQVPMHLMTSAVLCTSITYSRVAADYIPSLLCRLG